MKLQRVIMLADCQSFYASVEKAAKPELRDKPLVVAGDPERRSGIVLAACPLAKSFGITTAERLGEALAKCPDLIVVKPRMKEYIDVSMQITDILRTFTDLVEPYSIDEQFLDVTGSENLFGGPISIAQQIRRQVMSQTGINTRVGISYCKVIAKMACDNFAKKNADGIFVLPEEDLQDVLWPLPVNKMFMVGSRMTQHFTIMGMPTIGDIAKTPLGELKRKMKAKFGKQSDINAEMYWRMANGNDDSPVDANTHEIPPKSVGHQMTLPVDYRTAEDLLVVLLELTELVCRRCRGKGFMGWVVSVGCQGADYDRPTGFHRQIRMPDPTSVTADVFEYVEQLFLQHWDDLPVRKVGVGLADLVGDQEYQLVLFGDREKKMALERATDAIKDRYGDASIVRAVSISPAGQASRRSKMIGGHSK